MQGKILKDHPPMKLFVSISGTKFKDPSICEVAYKDPITVKSVHFIGAKDWLKLPSQELASAFKDPLIINHPYGHTVPRLGAHLYLSNFYSSICRSSKNTPWYFNEENLKNQCLVYLFATDLMYTNLHEKTDEEALKKLSNWIANVGEAALHVGNGVLNENKSTVEKAEKGQKDESALQEEENK